MNLLKLTSAAILAGALMACEDTAATSLKAAPGQSVDEVARSLTQTRAIAVFIGRACAAQGISLREPNIRRALSKDIANLERQGYAAKDLRAAFSRAGKGQSLINSSVAYLEARGAKRGDIGSVCKVGLGEIAAKTPVGRLLKKG